MNEKKKMSKEEYQYVKKVYNDNVLHNYLDKKALEKAYRIITRVPVSVEPVVSVRKMKATIFNYFRLNILSFVKAIDEILSDPDSITDEELKLDVLDIKNELKQTIKNNQEPDDSSPNPTPKDDTKETEDKPTKRTRTRKKKTETKYKGVRVKKDKK